MAGEQFGRGISSSPDLGEYFALKSGFALLGERLVNRFTTPRGALFYDPGYGRDLRLYLNEGLTDAALAQLAAEAEAEAEAEEGITKATATVTTPAVDSLRIELALETSEGPLRLVLAVSAVTVELLRAEA
jgi:hypothetical protein